MATENQLLRMKLKTIYILTALFAYSQTYAQETAANASTFSIETRITNLFQGGFEVGVFYNTSSNFSVGLQLAAQNVKGRAKELLFESSSPENLDIRLPWLVAVKGRYHFRDHQEGFYVETSAGIEQFKVRSGGETQKNNNGFLLSGIGYLWFPWERDGFYFNPNLGGVATFFRQEERTINDTSYALKRFFPSPAFSTGWKF